MSANRSAQLDGYVRVSRLGGRREENLSTVEQRRRIEGYCQAHGHSVREWFVETDESGGKSERPMWQRALARVESGESGGVICAKLDRFARSAADGLAAVRRIEQVGGTFVSVAENFDTSSVYGRFTMTIFLALAELELGRIRDGWAVAQSAAVRRGVHISARVPAGYRRNGDGRLQPDPETAPRVREVFLRRVQGGSWQQLASYLNLEQVPTFSGGQWTPGSVRAIVSNSVYKGEARGARGLVNPEAHEPIVSKAEWRAANRRRGEKPVTRGEGKLLSGLVCCGSCGGRMSADRNRHGSFYRCRNRIVSVSGCPRPATISGKLIEPYVVEAALALLPTLAHKPQGADSPGAAELEQGLAEAEANLAEFTEAWQAEGVLRPPRCWRSWSASATTRSPPWPRSPRAAGRRRSGSRSRPSSCASCCSRRSKAASSATRSSSSRDTSPPCASSCATSSSSAPSCGRDAGRSSSASRSSSSRTRWPRRPSASPSQLAASNSGLKSARPLCRQQKETIAERTEDRE